VKRFPSFYLINIIQMANRNYPIVATPKTDCQAPAPKELLTCTPLPRPTLREEPKQPNEFTSEWTSQSETARDAYEAEPTASSEVIPELTDASGESNTSEDGHFPFYSPLYSSEMPLTDFDSLFPTSFGDNLPQDRLISKNESAGWYTLINDVSSHITSAQDSRGYAVQPKPGKAFDAISIPAIGGPVNIQDDFDCDLRLEEFFDTSFLYDQDLSSLSLSSDMTLPEKSQELGLAHQHQCDSKHLCAISLDKSSVFCDPGRIATAFRARSRTFSAGGGL
jgi:hypothetical protein